MVFPSVELLPVTLLSNTCIPPPSSVLLRKRRQTYYNLLKRFLLSLHYSTVKFTEISHIEVSIFLWSVTAFPSSNICLCFTRDSKRSACSNFLWILWRLKEDSVFTLPQLHWHFMKDHVNMWALCMWALEAGWKLFNAPFFKPFLFWKILNRKIMYVSWLYIMLIYYSYMNC